MQNSLQIRIEAAVDVPGWMIPRGTFPFSEEKEREHGEEAVYGGNRRRGVCDHGVNLIN